MSDLCASPNPIGGTPTAGRSKKVEDLYEQVQKDVASLLAQVEVLATKVDGLKEAPPSDMEHDDEGNEEHREENENDGANTLLMSADTALMAHVYEKFPQHQGKSLTTICKQAIQEGAQATASLVSSSRPSTNTRASQRTKASAEPKKFFVQLKLWTIDRAGGRFFGGREIMEICDNSTLRDLEIQVENYVKDIQDGDIKKRANLKDQSVFHWSTEHVVENVKAMKHMDADEHTWSSVDDAITISKDNVKGIIDLLKRENQMPWLSVTIKLKDASER